MNNTDAAALRASQAETGQQTPQANTSVIMCLLPDYSYTQKSSPGCERGHLDVMLV